MPVESGSSCSSVSAAARHPPKQKRKAHSLSIRRANSREEERPPAGPPGALHRDMLEAQVPDTQTQTDTPTQTDRVSVHGYVTSWSILFILKDVMHAM